MFKKKSSFSFNKMNFYYLNFVIFFTTTNVNDNTAFVVRKFHMDMLKCALQ